MLRWSVWLHKWIGLIVSVQVLFWVLGGLIMTAIPIERVRGEHHAAVGPPPASLDMTRVIPAAEVADRIGFSLSEATLKATPMGAIWMLKSASGPQAWFDAYTGAAAPELGERQARAVAAAAYAGDAAPIEARRFEDAPPEVRSDRQLWRVTFGDRERTRLYIDSFTGEVVSRRSEIWRFYDFWYRLHLMSFAPEPSYNHPLIVGTTALTLLIVLTGFLLLWIKVGRDLRAALSRRSS
jgi:uncharacterized iron-regulated membrane protein